MATKMVFYHSMNTKVISYLLTCSRHSGCEYSAGISKTLRGDGRGGELNASNILE